MDSRLRGIGDIGLGSQKDKVLAGKGIEPRQITAGQIIAETFKDPEKVENSSNPYRQHQGLRRDVSDNSLSSSGTHPLSERKTTPAKAVFDDLRTAYSSITSGTARNQVRTLSVAEYDDSIPLQEMSIMGLPKRPDPAMLMDLRPETDHGFESRLVADLAGEGTGLEPKLSVLANIKNALAVSSPLKQEAQDEEIPQWPRESRYSGEIAEDMLFAEGQRHQDCHEATDAQYGIQSSGRHFVVAATGHQRAGSAGGLYQPRTSTASASEPHRYQRSRHHEYTSTFAMPLVASHNRIGAKMTSGTTDASLREGSTVGNIYTHYAASEVAETRARGSIDHKRKTSNSDMSAGFRPFETPPPLNIQKQRKGPAPSDQNSRTGEYQGQISGKRYQHTGVEDADIFSSSYKTGQPSSLIDQEPHLPRHKVNAYTPEGDSVAISDEAGSDAANSTLPSLPRISTRNPYHYNTANRGGGYGRARPENCVYDGESAQSNIAHERLPLERDVSQALRRASGYSAYSAASVDSSILLNNDKKNAFFRAPTFISGQDPRGGPSSDSRSLYDQSPSIYPPAQGFYDPSAIAPTWINSRQNIRVPINHNGSMPDSPPVSPVDDAPQQYATQRYAQKPSTPDDDWETVGESAHPGAYVDSQESGIIGGTIGRAGSSIADTSDAGASSVQLDDFGSTERIAQHPGNINYSGDYRQRDLKETNRPILVPVYQGHKVNGYLNDSSRVNKPNNGHYFQSPSPLDQRHRNPFNSSPPEVIPTVNVKRPKGILHTQFAQNNCITDSSKRSAAQNGNAANKSSSSAYETVQGSEWTNSYRQTGPATSKQNHPFVSHDNEGGGATSWAFVMEQANLPDVSASVTHYLTSLDPKPQGGRGVSFEDWLVASPKIDGYGTRYGPRNTEGRKKNVDIQNFIDRRVRESARPNQQDGPARSLTRRSKRSSHPTNMLRPLSLVENHNPSTPIRGNAGTRKLFAYRSPLAPPRRGSSQRLYTGEQLRDLQEKGRTDGVYASRSLSIASQDVAARNLYEAPHLSSRPSSSSTDTSLQAFKTKASRIVLVVSTFLPPFLIMYAAGSMDGLMVCFSRGKISAFGKKEKRWAKLLLLAWGLIAVTGLVVFLVWFFAVFRKRLD